MFNVLSFIILFCELRLAMGSGCNAEDGRGAILFQPPTVFFHPPIFFDPLVLFFDPSVFVVDPSHVYLHMYNGVIWSNEKCYYAYLRVRG